MTQLSAHPERNIIRLQLRRNVVLLDLDEAAWDELDRHLVISDGRKGEYLLLQGVREMEQYFILEGMPKSGHMANSHAKVAAAAIVAELKGWEIDPQPMLTNVCMSYVAEIGRAHV